MKTWWYVLQDLNRSASIVNLSCQLENQGLVIVCTRTWYGGIVSVSTSVVVTLSPSCKWTERQAAGVRESNVYCSILRVAGNRYYAKFIRLGPHYKSSKFVMEFSYTLYNLLIWSNREKRRNTGFWPFSQFWSQFITNVKERHSMSILANNCPNPSNRYFYH